MTGFELSLSIPADPRFTTTLTVLAAHAAAQAGCGGQLSAEFGAAVNAAAHDCMAAPGKHPAIDVVFRHAGAEIEAVLTCGTRIRVARPVPLDV